MFQDFASGSDSIGDLYLCNMESTDKPRGADGFWCVEETYKIFDDHIRAAGLLEEDENQDGCNDLRAH